MVASRLSRDHAWHWGPILESTYMIPIFSLFKLSVGGFSADGGLMDIDKSQIIHMATQDMLTWKPAFASWDGLRQRR